MLRWLSTLAIVAIALALVIAGRATSVAPSAFSHGKHGGIACLQCHHDWKKSRATQRCKGCHLDQPELRPRLEADFHRLCRGCHLDPPARPESAAGGARRGQAGSGHAGAGSAPKAPPPAARCSGCHAGPGSEAIGSRQSGAGPRG